MHVDPVYARRTQAGSPVVHGMHLLLWCLETLFENPQRVPPLAGLKARFLKMVYLGDVAGIVVLSASQDEIKVRVMAGDLAAVNLTVLLREGKSLSAFPLPSRLAPEEAAEKPRELGFDDLAGRSGFVGFAPASPAAIELVFPALTKRIGAMRVAALLALSRLVGMECPGLHSIFAGLQLSLDDRASPAHGIDYKVTAADGRFHKLTQQVSGGGLSGRLDAFLRVPPVAQPTMKEIAALIAPGEFAAHRILIVGGSRGLGELCAKALAAGGADVSITYAVGRQDAEQVADEIGGWGGSCNILKYDVREPVHEQLRDLADAPSHLYYFATGVIFRSKARLFVDEFFDEFATFYLKGFYALCDVLRKRSQRNLTVFFPSSVFVETVRRR
jgi:hypothetical protein